MLELIKLAVANRELRAQLSELVVVGARVLKRCVGKGLGDVEAKVNESSAQSGGSMSAKKCGAGVGV